MAPELAPALPRLGAAQAYYTPTRSWTPRRPPEIYEELLKILPYQ